MIRKQYDEDIKNIDIPFAHTVSKYIVSLEATIEALKNERNNMVKTHHNNIRKLEIDVRTLEAMDYANKSELEELKSKG